MYPNMCQCRECTGVPGSGIGTVVKTVLYLLELAGIVLARFFGGRVLFRPVGPWDATYQHWAPPMPIELARMRGAGYPRTAWARRPGYQRQAVRAAGVLAAVGLLVAPVLTIAAIAGAGLAAGGVAFAMHRDRPAPGQVRVAPDTHRWGAVRTANWQAVPPYANPYLQHPYVQTTYVSSEQPNQQHTATPVRATATRLDASTTREGRW